MERCFVIQPFDHGPYDKRYDDVIEPSVRAAGLEPYRVDRDHAVSILIADIERQIRNARACVADITEDNPNVWFELGFAIANDKPTILYCAAERERFPFDVQHRQIIRYKTESPGDFDKLGTEITSRLTAQLKSQRELGVVATIDSKTQTHGLSPHEIAVLCTAMTHGDGGRTSVTKWTIQSQLAQAGFTDIAASLGTVELRRKGFVEEKSLTDERTGEDYQADDITPKGIEWLLANQEILNLRTNPSPPNSGNVPTDDDLPF